MESSPLLASASASASAAPHVASLSASLVLVPPTAVPAIINCVLASYALSPSDLFHSLLHSFPDLTVAPQPNRILSHTSALCHLIKHTDAPPDALRLFIGSPLVPLLNVIDLSDSELLTEIVELLCDAVLETQSWELVGGTLVPFCLRTLGLCTAAVQNERMDACQWSSVDSIPGTLPWPTACRILTSLLDSALRSGKEIKSVESFTTNLIWDLSNLSLRLLQQSPENRSCVIHLLLPSVFSSLNALGSVQVLVHGSLKTFSRMCFLKKIWKCSMSLFSLGHIERLDAYSMLSLYFSSYSTKENGVASLDDTEENFDLKAQREFWEEIRRGLVDKGASVRKQALYILKISLNHSTSSSCGSELDACCSNDSESVVVTKKEQIVSGVMTKRERWADEEAKSLGIGRVCHSGDCSSSGQERWKVFLLLYEMLEEYGTHLVEAAWTHQVSLLFQSRPVSYNLNPFTSGVYQVQMETFEGIFSWLAVLWERGFFHENPQVRCLIMQSFFNIDWNKRGNCAQKVPRSFVLGPLILGLNDVVHHKDFGVKGVYTSETIEGAKRYFSEFSRPLSLSERAVFVWSLASVARQDAFGRAGLMTLAFCIASAASPSSPHNVGVVQTSSLFAEQMESAQDKFQPCSTSDLLDVLGIVIEKSKQHFNANYRLQVCEQVIKAASSLVNVSDVPFDVLLHFLSTVPREFTDCAGPLRGIVQQWLTQINNRCYTFGSVNMEIYVLKNLIDFPTNFIKHELLPDVCVAFNDEDVDAWEAEAHRWARLLFLVVTEEKHLEPIFVFLLNYASSLCKQDLNREWLPLKLLIIILSLVEEFQSVWRKLICPIKSGTHDDVGMTKILDQSSSLVLPIIYEKFSRPFLLILEELVSFAELVSSIFWSTSMVKDTQLPCSVTGKLGGPSPRRLASLTTYAVLQAIISIRAVACISTWCAELKSDDCLDPSFTFLWFFSWKVIRFPKLDSETAAEICLAAYEALASVMKAFSTMFTPLVFDFIMTYNKSLFPDEEGRPLLDPLTLNFLSNINDLLVTGLLARSRRAVLLNWKWRCLDSILSIPYNVVENRVHQKCAYPFFSDSTLISTFVDIIESLENAGETSVLPMLRSVRLVLGLLYSATTSPRISSCAGVNCQMMFQLVHSSWILHLSCNKRRVAPIAALLSAVLHRSVFSDMLMHDTNDSKPGPLKWFIGKLLDEGIKSPRTIRLAALHLTGLWLLYPKTIKYYTKELKLLSLYGSVAFDEDFEAELSENPEARTEVSLLAQIPDSELTEVSLSAPG